MKKFLAIMLILGCTALVSAQAPNDVPQGHWAYEAVNELMGKGYMIGYPNGDFLGDRTLTRYEFATIVARILEGVNEKLAAAKSQGGKTPAGSEATVMPTNPAAEVSSQDLDNIAKLAEEFKVELTVIGTRLDSVEAAVEALRSTVETHDGIVKSTASDIAKLNKIKVSGYVQSRYQNLDYTKDTTSEDSNYDTFLVRRARIKITATPTVRSTAVLQLDMGKNTASVKDAYFNYAFGDGCAVAPSFQIGQQNWWFGYEVPYSSSKRETPERALFVRRFFPGERDTGAIITSPANSKILWTLGAYNGTGIENGSTSATDNNDAKDVLANVKFRLGDLNLGLSGYHGYGIWYKNAAGNVLYDPTKKIRYGADMQYCINDLTFKGEYIRGRGFDDVNPNSYDQDLWQSGYYAQVGYNIDTADILVARYSTMSEDPKNPQYGRVSSWELGAIRWLDKNSRLKLFYKTTSEEFNEIDDNDGFVAEWIVTY
ncbi:MAG: porin [Armatimonadota bacterium]|nr:S-layer homology domain-containing protein [bacterium]